MGKDYRNDTNGQWKSTSSLTEFFNNSSIHGLSNIAQAKHWVTKFIWILVFLTLLIISIYTSHKILSEFTDYKAHLVHTYHQLESIELPSMTICNANNYQAHKIRQYFDQQRFVNQTVNRSLESGILMPLALYGGAWLLGTDNVTFMKETRSGSDILFPNDLDGWCTFQTFANCTKKDFVDSFYHSYLGICKTFNNDGKYIQKTPGSLSGLFMKFFINEDDYAPLLPHDMGAGVTLTVHPRNVFIDPLEGAVLLQPGTLTRIALKKHVYKRLQHPYPSKCIYKTGTELFPGPYTVSNCQHSCLQRAMYERCGVLEAVVIYNMKQKGMSVPQNKNLSQVDERCTADFYNFSLTGQIKCDCPLPCEEEVVTSKISSSKWPSKADMAYYRPVLAQILNRTDVSEQFVRDNMLSVKIFFDSIAYEEVVEKEAVSAASLFGSIGGAIGLCIGASCYSIVEILAFLTKIIVDCCKSAVVQPKN